jgi:predicted RecB family nuclease
MDVEGMPDRDFYYLIGLRYETRGTHVEQSFWADGPRNECDIWRECLSDLKEIDNPRTVHYGAYETRFLKHMRERWKPTAGDAEFVDRIVEGSVNLLARIYGRIYFPTYSNGLKEIARWLGLEVDLAASVRHRRHALAAMLGIDARRRTAARTDCVQY